MADVTGGMAALRLRSVSCTAVEVPLRYVLGTSAATVRAAPLLLVEVLTEQGVAGHVAPHVDRQVEPARRRRHARPRSPP